MYITVMKTVVSGVKRDCFQVVLLEPFYTKPSYIYNHEIQYKPLYRHHKLINPTIKAFMFLKPVEGHLKPM